jgi:hypothetical protein
VSSDSGIVTAWQPSFSLVRGPFSRFHHYIAQNPIGESRLRQNSLPSGSCITTK